MFFRMIFGLPGAAAITAFLFLAMGWLIRQDAELAPPAPDPDLTILAELKPTEPTRNQRPLRQTPQAPEPINIEYAPPQNNPGRTIIIDRIAPPSRGEGGPVIDLRGTQPTIRPQPAYPENCRARGAEGVVMVEFDVTPEGDVVNPRVVASENSCLDRSAIQTISKWKYTPQTDSSGRPIPQRSLRQVFNYQLSE